MKKKLRDSAKIVGAIFWFCFLGNFVIFACKVVGLVNNKQTKLCLCCY